MRAVMVLQNMVSSWNLKLKTRKSLEIGRSSNQTRTKQTTIWSWRDGWRQWQWSKTGKCVLAPVAHQRGIMRSSKTSPQGPKHSSWNFAGRCRACQQEQWRKAWPLELGTFEEVTLHPNATPNWNAWQVSPSQEQTKIGNALVRSDEMNVDCFEGLQEMFQTHAPHVQMMHVDDLTTSHLQQWAASPPPNTMSTFEPIVTGHLNNCHTVLLHGQCTPHRKSEFLFARASSFQMWLPGLCQSSWGAPETLSWCIPSVSTATTAWRMTCSGQVTWRKGKAMDSILWVALRSNHRRNNIGTPPEQKMFDCKSASGQGGRGSIRLTSRRPPTTEAKLNERESGSGKTKQCVTAWQVKERSNSRSTQNEWIHLSPTKDWLMKAFHSVNCLHPKTRIIESLWWLQAGRSVFTMLMSHNGRMWISLIGRPCWSLHPCQRQIKHQDNRMLTHMQMWWDCSVQHHTGSTASSAIKDWSTPWWLQTHPLGAHACQEHSCCSAHWLPHCAVITGWVCPSEKQTAQRMGSLRAQCARPF